MDLLAGSAERISAVSVTGANASRRICVSGSLYRIVRGQDFRGRFNQASATRLPSIAPTLLYNGFIDRCDVGMQFVRQGRNSLQDRGRNHLSFGTDPQVLSRQRFQTNKIPTSNAQTRLIFPNQPPVFSNDFIFFLRPLRASAAYSS